MIVGRSLNDSPRAPVRSFTFNTLFYIFCINLLLGLDVDFI